MRRLITRSLVVGMLLTTVTLAARGTADAHDAARSELAQARAATARFHQVDQATDDQRGALADLAGLTCIEDPGGEGGMGVHYVKGSLVGDGIIDVTQPEALLYDFSGPRPRLLGVEYVVFASDWKGTDPPSLFGHEFHLIGDGNRYGLPPFYELHAWIWLHNPNGMLADWNPRVAC